MPDRRSQGIWQPLCIVFLLCLCQVGSTSSRADTPFSADTIKAVFLYRFAGYVEWPGEAAPSSPFTIAVLGQSNVASELERLLPKQSIKGRPAALRRIRDIRAVGDAQILFIAAVYEDPRPFIAQLGSRPVLVVTELDRGLDRGSTLNFLVEDRRVRFEVSLDAAERAKLRISSELLAVAVRVLGGPKRSAFFESDEPESLTSAERRSNVGSDRPPST